MNGADERIGRYRVTRELGRGGMGVVYAAHDERLDRPVAVKVIRPESLADAAARERFRQEARAAARVSHPHICPLFEFDEDEGRPFLVMELLEGEPLSARLERGPMTVTDTLGIALPMLDALAALHRRGLLHRDLKPANVFLTPHGVKLLDFGLAQPPTADEMTQEVGPTGRSVVGTPRYMAPEQLFGHPVDERSDLFAAGAVIHEMLAGRPAFPGASLSEIVHAVGYVEPAHLDGSREIQSIDRVLRQAMAKDPADRVARADVLAALLRDAVAVPHVEAPAGKPKTTRFVALPLRILRPDPETDFLAFSVPDAVSSALAGLRSVIVRSPQAAPAAVADVRAIGRDLAVDVVLTGTLLRSGADVRVSAQLTDAAAGTILWSDRADAPIADLFRLQDTLTERIVSSLALPLSAADRHVLDRQTPASAEAYELYMRANQLSTDAAHWEDAMQLYERSIALDPTYAPAWARLGRIRRVVAKWGGPSRRGLLPQAEAAFRRALDLDPELSMAHHLAAFADAELGHAADAMIRLLRRAASRPNDAQLLAGLVTVCRYAGLLDASLAAWRRAVAIDPACETTVAWTHLMRGDYAAAIEAEPERALPFISLVSRVMLGTIGVEEIRRLEQTVPSPGALLGIRAHRHALEGNAEAAIADLRELGGQGHFDPEGRYVSALLLVRAGALEPALGLLAECIDHGYACHEQLTQLGAWQPAAHEPAFRALVERTRQMVARARQQFEDAGGPRLLGL
jgi:TolB-like protein/predicted Ser/Thr protein kinase